MTISVFDLFKVGIGPSSSHTVGPMKAARMFAEGLRDDGLMPRVRTVRVSLYGSLGLTGKGHGSDKAVLLGLEGEQPATVDVDAIPARLAAIAQRKTVRLLGEHEIGFTVAEHLEFNRRKKLSYHPNGMRFAAYDDEGGLIRERVYYSVGGGFVVGETITASAPHDRALPYPFTSGAEMLAHARMTCHSSPRPACTCSDVRPSAFSFSSMIPETGRPLRAACASISAPLVNG
jgi:L-serine dehydratase